LDTASFSNGRAGPRVSGSTVGLPK
jgi:hypothetical protein